ncbi:16484_t:CDS:10 [Acaulospora colombiana]|uniref:16484_t:CDS:1 n=1 Tax=Acaulospora colombiana TaxID=27376 RepID=A0ACA9K1F2_9GLOM|nr:16484_t:CDS:10 [Acaulospora colombiana]
MDPAQVPNLYKQQRGPPKIKNKTPAPIQITAEQILREAKERQEAARKEPRQKISDLEELSEYRLRKRKEFEDSIRRNRLNIGSWLKYAAWEESQKELNRYKYTYMEEMLGNVAGSRQIFERWMQWEPDESAWNAYIKMERRYNETDRARAIYERFVSVHPEPKNWLKWVKFEEEQHNLEKCREIYSRAIEALGEDHIEQKIFISFAKFETKLKEVCCQARIIFKYALEKLPRSKSESLYNAYTQFEKQYGDKEGIEDVVVGKRRVQYDEELKANPKNYDVWFDYARLEESVGDTLKVREIYERAISQVPPTQEKRFWRRYIYLWINYALYEELETMKMLGDYDRCRAIFELAVDQPILDMPELLWKAYIDFEFSEEEFEKTRQLYKRLLEKTGHVKVWISFAQFELNADGGDREDAVERSRNIFETAYKSMKEKGLKEERVLLLESWKDFESNNGTHETLSNVESKLPKVVKKRRKLEEAEGQAGVTWEEYFDYIFPDDQAQQPNFKLLERAYAWRQQKLQQQNTDKLEQPQQQNNVRSETFSAQQRESPRDYSYYFENKKRRMEFGTSLNSYQYTRYFNKKMLSVECRPYKNERFSQLDNFLKFKNSSKMAMAASAKNRNARLPPEVNRVLFVRNLPFNITSEEMYDIFGKYGAIRQIRLGCEKDTRGTAFVVYEDIFDAKAACDHLNGFNVMGRYLIVLYYQPNKITKKMNLQKKEEELKELKR